MTHQFRKLLQKNPYSCFPTAISCLLLDQNVEDMPRYLENNFEIPGFWELLADFFEERGYEVNASFIEFGLQGPADGRPVIALGKSPRGRYGHAVIYQNGKLLHDVHESNDGIIAPHTYIWFESIQSDCYEALNSA